MSEHKQEARPVESCGIFQILSESEEEDRPVESCGIFQILSEREQEHAELGEDEVVLPTLPVLLKKPSGSDPDPSRIRILIV